MIEIKGQEELFIRIASIMEKKIIAYAIGGTALMLRGLKDATLDIDLVFENDKDRNVFIDAVKKLGFPEEDAFVIYRQRKDVPLVFKIKGSRIDLFLEKIITSTFSSSMKERANHTHEFGKNFIVKAANPHDILIMKSATDREKDNQDIISIINKTKIDWDIILSESKEQVKLGNGRAILDLGYKLEKLKRIYNANVPDDFLNNKLWELLNKQVDSKESKEDKM